MALLKERFNLNSLHKLALEIQNVYDEFLVKEFLESTMDKTWNDLEFKQRVRKISTNLRAFLPNDYKTAIKIIDQVIDCYPSCLDGFVSFFPDFIEQYGLDEKNWDISINALARYTQYASSEFAVRAFILKDEKRMMKQMSLWATDDNEHIRRLASEGCRPRLPWGQALPNFQKDPSSILPILEQLKNDSSIYVRKSVANNINDISKTNPKIVEKLAKEWYGKSKNTDWIIKHGCRTLLKNGNTTILNLFGLSSSDFKVENFKLEKEAISIDQNLCFSFEITAKPNTKVRLEYAIDYKKANGLQNRKLFYISEITIQDDKKKAYKKTLSFSDNSTRKHYQGNHKITLIINGIEIVTKEFIVN